MVCKSRERRSIKQTALGKARPNPPLKPTLRIGAFKVYEILKKQRTNFKVCLILANVALVSFVTQESHLFACE